jgi:AcrR family transcriptional regulator
MRIFTSKDEVREAILDAVDVLLGRYGYKKMTIEDVAREAKIGKGTVYLYFESKEELVLSHIDRIVRRVMDDLNSIAGEDANIYDRLERMLVLRVMKRCEAVQHYTQSLNELLTGIREQLLARRRQHFEAEAAVFRTLLARELGASEQQAVELAKSIIAATNSYLPYSLTVKELGTKPSLLRSVTTTSELLVKGIEAILGNAGHGSRKTESLAARN